MPRYRCRNCGKRYYSASEISFRCVVCGSTSLEPVSPCDEEEAVGATGGRPLGLGDHALLLFDDETQFVGHALPFMRDGLERSEAVMFVINRILEDALLQSIEPDERDAIEIVFSGDRYGPGFDPERTLAAYERDIAATAGPLRVFAVADFNGRELPPTDLMSYEATAHNRLIGERTCAVCAFDTRSASEYTVRAARRVHPLRCTGREGMFVANPSFDPTLLS